MLRWECCFSLQVSESAFFGPCALNRRYKRVNRYRFGRIAERKVANDLKEKGFTNIRRSAGSRGPADIYARKGDNRYYVQVKSNTAYGPRLDLTRLS